MRGRTRKPTAVLEAKGAFEKDPQRKASRTGEPEPNGPIGDPPKYFNAFHRAIWFEIIDECPKGVLARSDRKILELATRLTAKMRNVPARMPKWLKALKEVCEQFGMDPRDISQMENAIHASLGVSSQELTLLATSLTRMGMTPADRSRVQVEPEKPQEDPLDAIVQALTGGNTTKSVQ
jgi:hypothetical protein